MNSREEILRSNLASVEDRILRAAQNAHRAREEITLVAVTKTYPASDVAILKKLGIENFGENRDDEGVEKSAIVAGCWHFQGQIQSKKIRSIASWASVIHSLDQENHISKLGNLEIQKKLQVFLQLSLDGNPSRGGVTGVHLPVLADLVLSQPNLTLMGIMSVPPLEWEPRKAFTAISAAHTEFMKRYPMAQYLSAGMSGDFEVAISYGATHIRIGSQILGSRPPAP